MKFFRNVLGTLATEVTIVAVNFLVGVLVARLLPISERGVLALVMLLPVTLAYFADIGVSQSIVYLIARRKRPVDVVLGNSLVLALVIGGSIALLMWLARDWILMHLLRDVPPGYFPLLLALLPLLLVDTYLLSVLRANQRFALFNLRRLVTPLLLLAGVILLVGVVRLGVRGAVAAFVFSSLASLALAVLILRRETRLRLAFDRQITTEALGFGAKSYLQNLVGHLHYRLDVYLLALFLPPAQVALYTVATSVAEIAFYIPDSVGTVLFPRLSAESDERIHSMTAEVTRHTLGVSALASLGIAAAGWLLIPAIYGSEYRPAVIPFLLLLPGILAMVVYKVLTRNYTSRNRQQVTIVAAGLALGLNVLLNLLMIPRWGVTGAALASMLSYSASAALLLGIFSRQTGIPLRQVLFYQPGDFTRIRQAWESLLPAARRSPPQPPKTADRSELEPESKGL